VEVEVVGWSFSTNRAFLGGWVGVVAKCLYTHVHTHARTRTHAPRENRSQLERASAVGAGGELLRLDAVASQRMGGEGLGSSRLTMRARGAEHQGLRV